MAARSAGAVIGQRHFQGAGAREEAAARFGQPIGQRHVPAMVASEMDGAFAGEQVEGRDLEIVDAVDRPGIGGPGLAVADGAIEALGEARFEPARVDAMRAGRRDGRRGSAEAVDRRCRNRFVLAGDEARGLRRPGHDLGVEQQPVGAQFVP